MRDLVTNLGGFLMDVTSVAVSHQNSLGDPFGAFAPWFCIGSSPTAHSLNKTSTPLRMTYRSLVWIISFDFFCIILFLHAILFVVFCKEEKDMDKQMQKVMAIVAGSVAGVALLGGAFYMIWNSKQAKAMRAVHRTNMILRRVGNVLCKIAAADEACV